MDTSVKPCDDFYQYSCGSFVKKNYIPDDENSLQSFNLVRIEVQNHLRGLLEDNSLKKNHSKVRTIYTSDGLFVDNVVVNVVVVVAVVVVVVAVVVVVVQNKLFFSFNLFFFVLQFPNSAVSKAFNYYSSCMNISHIEKAGQIPIGKLVENFGSSPMLQENWTETNWNLERTLGRVMGNLGLGVLVALDVSASLFNTSHRSLGVSRDS